MSNTTRLEVEPRGTARVKHLRETGVVPGVIYSRGKSTAIKVGRLPLTNVLRTHGVHRPIMVTQGENGEEQLAIIKDVQRDILTQEPVHVDLMALAKNETVKAEIPVMVHGTDELRRRGFMLLLQMNTLPVEGLPHNLPESIQIAGAELPDNATLTVADLAVPEGVTVTSDPTQVVLTLNFLKVQAEPEEAEAMPTEEPAAEKPAD